jgi:hypothetical protein
MTGDHASATNARVIFSMLALSLVACSGDGEIGRPLVGIGFFGVEESSVWAAYYRLKYGPVLFIPPCQEFMQIGDCEVPRDCPEMRTPSYEFVTGDDQAVDPGQVTVAGVPLPAEVGAVGYFKAFAPPLPLGEPIALSVAGSSVVPAHAGEFVIPSPITVTEPDLSGTVVVDRTRPLRVSWTPAVTGEVTVSIYHDEEADLWVRCSAPGSAGGVEMPVEVLAYLPDRIAAEGQPVSFSVSQHDLTQLHPENWLVNISTSGRGALAPADIK